MAKKKDLCFLGQSQKRGAIHVSSSMHDLRGTVISGNIRRGESTPKASDTNAVTQVLNIQSALIEPADIHRFTKLLLAWYAVHGRDLPWRHQRPPYDILVSEFMLQQTQVPRVIPKYLAFLERFPTVHVLAQAQLSDVLRMWQGLGYNRRAKFLHDAAKTIVERFDGIVPSDVQSLRTLPGVGAYTAGAIAALAYDVPEIAIDVNVERVFRYVFGIEKDQVPRAVSIAVSTTGASPRDFYNAVMDVGSIFYKENSDYSTYPFKEFCKYFHGKRDVAVKSAKQSTFRGSSRYYRGKIMTMLCAGPLTHDKLVVMEDGTKYAAAAVSMAKENLIKEKNGKYFL